MKKLKEYIDVLLKLNKLFLFINCIILLFIPFLNSPAMNNHTNSINHIQTQIDEDSIKFETDIINIKDYVPPEKFNLSRIGIIGNSTFNLHTSSFKELDPNKFTNCCTEFTSGNGLGINLGIFYSHQVTKIISFEYSLGLNYFDATLKETENKVIEIDNVLQNAEILHQLETSLRYVQFDYKVKLDIVNNTRFVGGLLAAMPIITEMNHFEQLIIPENRGSFENGRRIRNEYKGDIPNTNKILFGITAGLEYDFYLNKKKTYAMTPQFIIGQTFNSIINTNPWNVTFFRFGFAFSHNSYNDFDSPLAPTQ